MLAGTGTGAAITWIQIGSADADLSQLENRIRSTLEAKGTMMSKNHALALTGLVADNAISDVRTLVASAVAEDPEPVYGLFLSTEGKAWVYASPDPALPGAASGWETLKIPPSAAANRRPARRTVTAYAQKIWEFSAAVIDDGEMLGTIRYGISHLGMDRQLAVARAESQADLMRTLGWVGVVVLINIALGLLLGRRLASKITEPLAQLTSAATPFAQASRLPRCVSAAATRSKFWPTRSTAW